MRVISHLTTYCLTGTLHQKSMQQENLQKAYTIRSLAESSCRSLSLYSGKVFPPPPVKIDTTTPSHPPLNLACWMVDNKEEINKRGSKVLYSRGEFKVGVVLAIQSDDNTCVVCVKVTVWGGDVVQEGGGGDGETFLWQLKGSAEVTCDRGSGILSRHSCTLIQAGEK